MFKNDIMLYALYEIAVALHGLHSTQKAILSRVTFPGFKENDTNWELITRNLVGGSHQCIARLEGLIQSLIAVKESEKQTPNPDTEIYFSHNPQAVADSPLTAPRLAPPNEEQGEGDEVLV